MSKIRELRKSHGLTQSDLATELKVSQSAVAKWENGDNFPRSEVLCSMAALFNCTIDELVKGG